MENKEIKQVNISEQEASSSSSNKKNSYEYLTNDQKLEYLTKLIQDVENNFNDSSKTSTENRNKQLYKK